MSKPVQIVIILGLVAAIIFSFGLMLGSSIHEKETRILKEIISDQQNDLSAKRHLIDLLLLERKMDNKYRKISF